MESLNPHLDEWLLVRQPFDYAQCIALLEQRTLKKRLSKLETINHIISLLNGFESELFIWNSDTRRFTLTNGYAMKLLNSTPFRNYLRRFIPLGSMYRRMSEFVETEYFRGKTFNAYQNILKKILLELMENTLKVRNHFFATEKDTSDKNIRLVLLESYLDSDQNGNLFLSLRNLYAIYCDIIDDKNTQFNPDLTNSTDLQNSLFQMETSLYRHYCRQTLESIYDRLIIPDERIRSLTYTMLEYCLRPMFITLESMLKSFSSLSELASNEFLFDSKFRSDYQLYYTSYSPGEMCKFWSDFLFIEDQFKSLRLFQFESLDLLTEAIKCSFAIRKNSLHLLVASLQFNEISILQIFRRKMFIYLKLYSHQKEIFDIENDFEEIVLKFDEPNLLRLPEQKIKKFKTFRLPLVTVYNLPDLVQFALNETFESISRPIVQKFLPELRGRYLKLFHYYSNFFLCQNAQHILLYMHFLFPQLKDHLLFAKLRGTFSSMEQLLNQIHQYLQDDPSIDDNGLRFFKPHISFQIQSTKFKQNENDFDWIMHSFDSFYYLPSFANDSLSAFNTSTCTNNEKFQKKQEFYDFWPITQMFNPKITDLFNELFQFLLRLRYFQYLIGNDFLLSSRFRYNDLEKNIYLFRFRLANLIFQLGHQMEYRLQELIQQTEHRFHETHTISQFFQTHQKFLEKLEQIKQRVLGSDFIRNQFRTIAKFCHSNSIANSLAQKLTDTVAQNRKISIWKNMNKLDQVQQEDFNF